MDLFLYKFAIHILLNGYIFIQNNGLDKFIKDQMMNKNLFIVLIPKCDKNCIHQVFSSIAKMGLPL